MRLDPLLPALPRPPKARDHARAPSRDAHGATGERGAYPWLAASLVHEQRKLLGSPASALRNRRTGSMLYGLRVTASRKGPLASQEKACGGGWAGSARMAWRFVGARTAGGAVRPTTRGVPARQAVGRARGSFVLPAASAFTSCSPPRIRIATRSYREALWGEGADPSGQDRSKRRDTRPRQPDIGHPAVSISSNRSRSTMAKHEA